MEMNEKKLKSESIYQGRIVDLYKDEVLLPNGNIGIREVIRHCEASCIIAVKEGKIIMEKQYRYPYDEIMIELPAGKLDKNETPIKAAQRELLEETGYYSEDIIYLGKLYPSVAYCDEVIHLFLAENLIKKETHLDEDEFLEIYFDDLKNIIKQIKNGEIKDAKTICGIQQYLIYKNLINID